jgi:LPXTG-motif cell wall-anchored protein
MKFKTLRLAAIGAIATVGIPFGSVALNAAPAGAASGPLTSCSITPSTAVWNASNIEHVTLTGTPSDGTSVQVLWVKPGGSDTFSVASHNEQDFISGTLPEAGQEAASYASFLSLVGGDAGEIRVGYFPAGTTDFSGSPLCDVTIAASAAPAPTTTTTTTAAPTTTTTTAPKTVLAATGSDSEGMILLGSLTALFGAGAVVVSRRRSHATK